ncbi:glycine zipper 2TM domain-containing protein [Altererythrobacter endophyticus]|uniref:17 kDa surface antigen n=2 Tax=Altericroceibacterium endophyticum TaxID=1808508 RepID=A0A6I4T6V7_9SPHN|nr:glycine zipper 2TM domain-containing protein [Altericroceibacterium endophyticum]
MAITGLAPAAAADFSGAAPVAAGNFANAIPVMSPADQVLEYGRDRGRHEGWHRGRGHRDRYDRRDDRRVSYRGERVRRDTRVWRGRDGRYRCEKENGTTGLLIGGAVGGLAGNQIAGRGDKTLGTLLGGVVGALAGREIDRSDAACR